MLDDAGFLREAVRASLQPILEEELTAHLGTERDERTDERTGYRKGAKPRTLTTRFGRRVEEAPTLNPAFAPYITPTLIPLPL